MSYSSAFWSASLTVDSLGIPQLSDKGLDSPPFSIDNHLSKYRGVGGSTSRSSDPPLGSSEMRGVDDELVGSRVEGSGSLESGDVGSVGKLGHSKAPNDTVHPKNTLVDPVAYSMSAKSFE